MKVPVSSFQQDNLRIPYHLNAPVLLLAVRVTYAIILWLRILLKAICNVFKDALITSY